MLADHIALLHNIDEKGKKKELVFLCFALYDEMTIR
jgi:hypothetical protein